MASFLPRYVLRILCDHQGWSNFQNLDETVSQGFTVAEAGMQSVLSDQDRIAIQEGKQKAGPNKTFGPDTVIVAKTNLRLCQRRFGECSQCDALHLCKFFVLGGCTFG